METERNAQAGLKRIKTWKPHVVVSDYIVHGLDFFEFASKVEELQPKACMVVVSSHYLDGTLISQLRNLSRVLVTVQKPIKPDDLLERIVEFVPTIEITDESEVPQLDEPEDELDDLNLTQEVARLYFEGKDLPRFVSSLKALTTLAREQPHKPKYLREALEQCKRSIEEIRRQNLPHLEAPFEKITGWLNEIIEQGSLPSLELWDYVQNELESLSEPRKRIGTVTLSADTLQEEKTTNNTDTQFQPPTADRRSFWTPSVTPTAAHQTGRALKFLIIGSDLSEHLLNLGSRYAVSITIKDNLEQAQEACMSGTFDLIVLLLPSTLSGERARETVVATHEMLREIESYSDTEYRETPLVILAAAESLHTRIVTAHLNNAHWISWSGLRKSDAEFLALKKLAAQPIMRPAVLIIDSDISDSEDLLRELSRKCARVDTVRDPDAVIKAIEENPPDMILISERIGDLSGLDLCRAIRSCISFKRIVIVLEIHSISEGALKGAFRAGIDGIISKTESIESRAESMLSVFQRNLISRIFSDETSETSLQPSAAVRDALEKALKKAVENQSPLSICLIDLSENSLTCDDFAHLWNSKQREQPDQNGSAVHFLSQTQLLLSIVGLRKPATTKLLDELLEDADHLKVDDKALAWKFQCRCYPDDALSLADLLRFF